MANQFLTIDEVTSEAMSIVPGATTEEQLLARQWAYIALREIGPSSDNIDIAILYPDNFKLIKPVDYHRVIDLALYNAQDQELITYYRNGKKRIHVPYNIYQSSEIYSPTVESYIELSEDAYAFNLSSNAGTVAYAKLRYFKFPVDENNQPMFPEFTRYAVMMFIRYMWSLRMGDQQFGSYLAEWKMARAEARGKAKLPNGLLYKKLATEWVTMIPNFNTLNSF